METAMEKEKKELIPGEATKRLAELIPIGNIRTYFNIYHIIKAFTATPREKTDFPMKEYRALEKGFLALRNTVWLNDTDLSELIKNIVARGIANKKDELVDDHLAEEAKILKHKRGIYKNRDIDFLIYAINYDLKLYNKKRIPGDKWTLICAFLNEQNIVNPGPEGLERYYQRVKDFPLWCFRIFRLIEKDQPGLLVKAKDPGLQVGVLLHLAFWSGKCAASAPSEWGQK